MLLNTLQSNPKTSNIQLRELLLQKNRLGEKFNWYLRWLTASLFLEQCLLLGTLGVWLAGWGLSLLWQQTPISYLVMAIARRLTAITAEIPSYVTGSSAIALGLYSIYCGHTHATSSNTSILNHENDRQSRELLVYRGMNHSPKIVAIGGGTGLSNLLKGLKQYSSNITAIVTVADDGGSSGRLRREFGILPPGDLRNCIAALAEEENLLTELFQYRFQAGEGLKGHSFGNLLLTAMTEITGSLEKAIAVSSEVLAVRGRVLPATLSDVKLWAELDTGELIVGESKITEARGRIERIGCLPANPPALPAAIKAIEEADCIVIGPGSLYTSIIPNLLVPEIRKAIVKATVPRIYLCNIMTQPGETESYSVADHIQALDRVSGHQLFDTVLVNRGVPSSESLFKYAQGNSYPVVFDRERVASLSREVILAEALEENKQTNQIRHDVRQLAKVILQQVMNVKLSDLRVEI